MTEQILKVRNLSKSFPVNRGWFGFNKRQLRAVRAVSLSVHKGDTLGVIGESGCGKTTLARMLVGLQSPDAGEILIDRQHLHMLDSVQRGRAVQYVFQDPISSLNPRMTIGKSLETPLRCLHSLTSAQRKAAIIDIIDAVKLPVDSLARYPHEFSGGQAQRIAIARALLAQSPLIVLDEPVSALDVSVQAQIIELLTEIKQKFDLTYIFISHDLSVIEAVCDQIAVMYFGEIVEYGDCSQILMDPKHPYTRLLASSAPQIGKLLTAESGIGQLPDPLDPPGGCSFAARCRYATNECIQLPTPRKKTGNSNYVICHHPILNHE